MNLMQVDKLYHIANPRSSLRPIARFVVNCGYSVLFTIANNREITRMAFPHTTRGPGRMNGKLLTNAQFGGEF